MKHDPPDFDPEAAAGEPAAIQQPDFETPREEWLWWSGLAEGLRAAGAPVPPAITARLKSLESAVRSDDPLDFEPVPVKHRSDGFTPKKQRLYVEALAETGDTSEAAARVGMTERSANRLRQRPDARGFDMACEAALELGLRRLRSVQWERAVNGVVQQIWYHGELKGERRVYSDRLLIHLIDKGERQLGYRPEERKMVLDDWEGWMEQLEQGFPGGVPEPFDPEQEPEDKPIWQDESSGQWWTRFPPPEDFEGEEKGRFGSEDYQRRLSEDEQAQVDDSLARMHAIRSAERDTFFGFERGD